MESPKADVSRRTTTKERSKAGLRLIRGGRAESDVRTTVHEAPIRDKSAQGVVEAPKEYRPPEHHKGTTASLSPSRPQRIRPRRSQHEPYGRNSAQVGVRDAENWASRLLSSAGLPVSARNVASRNGTGQDAVALLDLALSPVRERQAHRRPFLTLPDKLRY
jgi:hypothetical protein